MEGKFIPMRIYSDEQWAGMVKTYETFTKQVETLGLDQHQNAEKMEATMAVLVAMVEKHDMFSPTAGAMAQALYDAVQRNGNYDWPNGTGAGWQE